MQPFHTEKLYNMTIEVHEDLDPPCPWEDGGCEPPIAVYSGAGGLEFYGFDGQDRVPTLTREQIKQHGSAIADVMGYTTLLRALRDTVRYAYHDAVEWVNDAIREHFAGLHDSKKLEFLCATWQWAGAPARVFSRNGYSQGDWADVLVVLTEHWYQQTGAPRDCAEADLKNAADLYAAWAYGDVYGWVIRDLLGDPIEGCWGYFGVGEAEYGGALDDARSCAKALVPKKWRARM